MITNVIVRAPAEILTIPAYAIVTRIMKTVPAAVVTTARARLAKHVPVIIIHHMEIIITSAFKPNL